MGITGAILGDIAGSQYEFDRPKNLDWENCELFTEKCMFTDDTVMSLAVKYAIDNSIDYLSALRNIGQKYPLCGYGGKFYDWIFSTNPAPYKSYGNGSAMRVSYIGEYFTSKDDVIREAKASAIISHNSREGIKGAVTTAVCVWMGKTNVSKQDIYDYMLSKYPEEKYEFSNKPLSYLRKNYKWDISCMTSVPVALRCVYESDSYISFLRNVFSLDCDCDTLCAIGGGIAEEIYKKTGLKNEKILEHYLDDNLLNIWRNNNGEK